MTESNECLPSQPTAQHAWIMQNVGTWTAHCKFFVGPDQPPMELVGEEKVEAHGAFFTVGRFAAEMMGMPFVGLATIGYDTYQEHFVSTWIDSMSPHLFHFTGQLDAAGEVLELTARAPAPMTGQMTDWRSREAHLADGSRRFELFVTMPGGGEMRLFEHRYVRA